MAANKPSHIDEYHLNKDQPQKQRLHFALHDLQEYLEKHGAKASKAHIHSYYQIIWFRSGEGKHVVDFREYDVTDNSLFFIAKNQVHYFDQQTHYKGLLIHFNELFLVQQENELDFLMKCSLFNNPYQQPSCGVGGDMERVLDEYIRQIRAELEGAEEFGREELLRVYLKAFLIQVQRRKNELDKAGGEVSFLVHEKKAQLIHFVNMVEEHYTKGLTVAEYAERLHISTRTLSDLTHQLLNKTPSLMIQERIILEAQRLLLHSNLNVNQVGYRLGFDDPSYFVKFFKKHAKSYPSEFRKSLS